MTFSDKDRSRTLALVRDVAECELEFSIENVCAVLGCDCRFPKYSWQRIAELMDTDASDEYCWRGEAKNDEEAQEG